MNSPFRKKVGDADLKSRVAKLEAHYEWLAQELLDERADRQKRRTELRNDTFGLTALGAYLQGAAIGLVILVGAFSLVLILGNL